MDDSISVTIEKRFRDVHEDYVNTVLYYPGYNRLCSGSDDFYLVIVDTDIGKTSEKKDFSFILRNGDTSCLIKWNEDGEFLSCGDDGEVVSYNVITKTMKRVIWKSDKRETLTRILKISSDLFLLLNHGICDVKICSYSKGEIIRILCCENFNVSVFSKIVKSINYPHAAYINAYSSKKFKGKLSPVSLINYQDDKVLERFQLVEGGSVDCIDIFRNKGNEEMLICGCEYYEILVYSTSSPVSIMIKLKAKFGTSSCATLFNKYVFFGEFSSGCIRCYEIKDELVLKFTEKVHTKSVSDIKIFTNVKQNFIQISSASYDRSLAITKVVGLDLRGDKTLERRDLDYRIEFLNSLLSDVKESSHYIFSLNILDFLCDSCNFDESPPKFGREMKEKCFNLDPDGVFCNHGGFGVPSKPVSKRVREFMDMVESNPDNWFWSFFYDSKMEMGATELIKESQKLLGEFVNADGEDIRLVATATEGVNSVLRSYPFTEDDTIMYVSMEYAMVKNCIQWVHDRFKTNIVEVSIPLPIKNVEEGIIEKVISELKKHKNQVTFAVLDHITSKPTVKFPVKRLTEIFHEHGAHVFVDGAHAIGQVPINIKDMNPDFYTSNLHKWMYASQETAFLYVKKEHQDKIFPPVISFFYKQGFEKDFSWMATRDWSPRMSIPEVLKFRSWVGDEKTRKYSNALCREVQKLFIEDWKVEVSLPDDLFDSIATVQIPCKHQYEKNCEVVEEEVECSYDWDLGLVRENLFRQNIWPFLFEYGGKRYLRLSCSIYNELEDFVIYKEKLNELIGWE